MSVHKKCKSKISTTLVKSESKSEFKNKKKYFFSTTLVKSVLTRILLDEFFLIKNKTKLQEYSKDNL